MGAAFQSLEANLGIQIPPIFNVCPHSIHRVFPRIDIATGIDWHERRVLLRAYFPTAVTAPFATCETA